MKQQTLDSLMEGMEMGIDVETFIDDDQSEFFVDELLEESEPQSYGSNVVYIHGKNGGFSNKDEYEKLHNERKQLRADFTAVKGGRKKKLEAAITYLDGRIAQVPKFTQIKLDRAEFRKFKKEALLDKLDSKKAAELLEERYVLTDEDRAKGRATRAKRWGRGANLTKALTSIKELFSASKAGMQKSKGQKVTETMLLNGIDYLNALMGELKKVEKATIADLNLIKNRVLKALAAEEAKSAK